MKKLFFRVAAIAAMMGAIVACDKENVGPAPETDGNGEGADIELTLQNPSDETRAFGAGTTETWEKSISSAVLIVYNTSFGRSNRIDGDADQIRSARNGSRCFVRLLRDNQPHRTGCRHDQDGPPR